ncbi:MAG: endonuclease/exonuclease/phosphatase family protein [Paramuribaculum sp.]|nr:endonuclease/exonuclease/phosphatase family protein [Paramuribaculum sp.]
MRNRILTLAVTLLAIAGTCFAQQYQSFGVAFYNLENLFDTIPNNPLGRDLEYTPRGQKQWGTKQYRNKLANLAQTIAAMTTQTTPIGPAVIGVSEIENKTVLDDLVKEPAIKKWMLQVVHHDSPDKRGVDVGLLYNPRLFKFIDVTNHRLVIPREGFENFRTRDQMCVTGILGGDTVSIIVNHWPSRLGGQEQSSHLREAAAALSKHIADSLWAIRPNQGVIIMGDLNDDPQDKSCANVLGAKKKAADVEPHGFYNPWWKMLDDGIGTLAYKGSWNLFDQIIVSGTLLKPHVPAGGVYYWKCQVNSFEFLKDTEGNRAGYPRRTYAGGIWLNGYSDHFPTEIFLLKEVNN